MTKEEVLRFLQQTADREYENMRDLMELADSPQALIEACEDLIALARVHQSMSVYTLE